MANTPTLLDAAKEILRVAVREQGVKPNETVSAGPIIASFNNLPWKAADLRPALIHAQQQGWMTEDGRLTAAGFEAAPPR
jgi:hypothetical protein